MAFRSMAMAAALTLAAASVQAQELTAAAMVGVWQGSEQTGGLVILGEALFMPDGTYSRAFRVGQMMTFQSGNYLVQDNWIHFTPTDYEPKVYLGVPQAPPGSETWLVDGFDGARIHAWVGATEMNYQRVQ